MANKISAVKNTASTGTGNMVKKVSAVLLSIIIIFFTFVFLRNADKAARDTVSVVRVKNSGLTAYTILTKDNVEEYPLIKKEFVDGDKGMILYEDVENIYGMLSAYYIRGNTVLYKDQLIAERPLRNQWLYEMPNDMEALTIPYSYTEAGGDILMPGDTIRIRVTYETEELPSESYDDDASYFNSGRKQMKTEIIFDSIVVTDMINSSSRSIYEIYKEVLKLDEVKREEVMKSSAFQNNIRPRALILSGTKEQADMYSKYKIIGSGNFLITILSRANSDVVLDQISTLESEVKGWVGN